MRTKDLIEQLKAMDPKGDREVGVAHLDNGGWTNTIVRVVKGRFDTTGQEIVVIDIGDETIGEEEVSEV